MCASEASAKKELLLLPRDPSCDPRSDPKISSLKKREKIRVNPEVSSREEETSSFRDAGIR